METTDYSELQSKTISFLRFPLMLMIVFIHNPHLKISMQEVDYTHLNAYNIYSIVVTLAHYTLTTIAVPCFFMFSGVFFFYKMSNFTTQLYISKLKKRVFTLVVPYILWNIISIVVKIIYETNHGGHYYYNKLLNKGILSIFWNYSEWTNILIQQTYYGPGSLELWFLRDLILTVILSPFIFLLIRYTKYFGLIALGLLFYFKVDLMVVDYNINQLIMSVFFFSIGAYFSISHKNMVLEFRKLKRISILLSILFLVASVYFFNTEVYKYILPIYIAFGIIAMINISAFVIEKKNWKEVDLLSKASFFIYLSHPILILKYSSIATNYIIPFNEYFFLILKYLLTPFICISICVFTYWLLIKYLSRFTSIITGGR